MEMDDKYTKIKINNILIFRACLLLIDSVSITIFITLFDNSPQG